MFEKILIANRGEIALRILRACKELGIKTVAIHSDIDKNLLHVRLADETVCIGPTNLQKSYLNIPAIISAAKITNSTAIHPGYGLLSENPDFADIVEKSGIHFIGPKGDTIRLMGNKLSAINTMKQLKIPCIPGTHLISNHNNKINIETARTIGYPIVIKAIKGGGGKGIHIVYEENDLKKIIESTYNQLKQTYNNTNLYMEKYISNPRHIEFQILGDGNGNIIYLGDRDCSIQRYNQKILEEAPALNIPDKIKQKIKKLIIKIGKKIKYRSAGTFEFLYKKEKFYFLEMNTRIQVEHPITEMITKIDLIKEQIKICNNLNLNLQQKNIKIHGHSIECRINAENPKTFVPSSGKINTLHQPGGPGIRFDSHIYNKYIIPPYYDSMIGKIISYGNTREEAIAKMQNALDEIIIDGIETNIELHKKIFQDPNFLNGNINTHYLNTFLNTKKNK
ncbi:acetyl-CoA carboxylase biotin carboxylase subunit [Candidatus Legionella polyplacis]|uniref:Biotin carboxylase n=1 Tax=Candidatus Legionella polyplacis TaxID=2005262 RepID=A0ABZ2GZT2_9GAMM